MRKGKYLMEIIMIGESEHKHIFERTDETFFSIKEKNQEEKEIEIFVEPKDLYEVPIFILWGLVALLLRGIVQHFIIVVNSEGKPISETAPSISGKVLKVSRDWKGLDKAVHDSFGSRFRLPRWSLVVIIVIAIGVILYLVSSGFIPMPNQWSNLL